MDFSAIKTVVIPDGNVKKIQQLLSTNLISSYQNGYRFNSNNEIVEQEGSVLTGYMQCVSGSKLYMMNGNWGSSNTPPIGIGIYTYVKFYNSDDEIVSHINGDMESLGTLPDGISITTDSNGITIFDFSNYNIEFTQIRMSVKGEGSNLIITNVYPDLLTIWQEYYNKVSVSIDTDGSIYNNGLGYKENYRIRSGGTEVAADTHVCTGFIPFCKDDILRINPAFNGGNSWNAINFFDSNFNNLGQIVDTGYGYGICSELANIYQTTLDGDISKLTYTDDFDNTIAYIRITHDLKVLINGYNLLITINEEI